MADEEDGADGAVGSFLLEGRAEAIAAGVAVQAEGAGVVGDGVPVGGDQDGMGGEVVKNLAYCGFHGRGEGDLGPLLEQGRGRS